MLGLSPTEARVVEHTLAVARARGLTYHFVSRPAGLASATILIIDGNRRGIVSQWRALKIARPALSSIVIVDSALAEDCPADQVLKRPLSAHNLIAALGELKGLGEPAATGYRPQLSWQHPTLPGVTPTTVVPPPLPEKTPRWTGRVLVIGSTAVCRQLNIFLTHWGLEVRTTEVVSLGVQLATSVRFDAVLVDTPLPDADAYQVCKKIKRSKAGSRVPVVLLTSKTSPFGRLRQALAARLAHCDSYLIKPVTTQPLEEFLAKYLRASPSLREVQSPRKMG